MPEPDGMFSRMLPFWVQWLFAAGGIVLLIGIVIVLWTKLTDIQKRVGRLEAQLGNSLLEGDETQS